MYDRPETAAVNDRLWSRISEQLPNAPAALDRSEDITFAWRDKGLVLSQTCGLPFSLWVRDHAAYVASPDFHLPDTPPGYYHSVVIRRADDVRSVEDLLRARPVINELYSQSGHAALQAFAQANGIELATPHISGGHALSARQVAENTADIATIDANTWRLVTRYDAFSSRLAVIARTPATPAMPFICGPTQDPAHIRAALACGIAALTDADCETIGLYGVTVLPVDAYFAVPRPEIAANGVKT